MVSIIIPRVRTVKEAVIVLITLWMTLIIITVVGFENTKNIVLLFALFIIITLFAYFSGKRYQKFRKE
jgi:hypothetical protein